MVNPSGESDSLSATTHPEPDTASLAEAADHVGGPAQNPGRRRPERATLGSVAARAGVSRQTVSNVINTPEIVRPDTAQRVRDAIAELAYRPHPADRRTEFLREMGVPFVAFGRPWDGPGTHSWVDVDGAAGTRAATEHLIAQGHTRIGFIGWPEGSEVGDDRLRGWKSAMRAAGLPIPAPTRCTNDIALGVRAAEQLIRGGDITAVVCVSDLLGLGTLSAASAHGLTVGSDLAVIGFDDSDRAQAAALSSIRQPLREVAEHCVRIMVEQIAVGPEHRAPEHVLLPPTLELRASTEGPG